MDWIEQFVARHDLPADYQESVSKVVAPLAKDLKDFQQRSGRPVIVGISGAQGTGKTTLAVFLTEWLERELGVATVCLSLDDMYLSKTERDKLAQEVHPLFATRGVPGTHDVGLAQRTLKVLADPDPWQSIALPAFDKARDDRAPKEEWRIVDAPADIVLFEGWCMGARSQSAAALAGAVNALEAEEDKAGTWRRQVNEHLKTDYAELFRRLDLLVMLRVPSFARVFEWRAVQEKKLRERLLGNSSSRSAELGQTPGELVRFIQHYERLTRHMLETMPGYSDAVIDLDDQHRMISLACPKRPA